MTTSGNPEDTREAIIRTLEEKTGVTLEDWVELVKLEGPDTPSAAATWLEIEHGLGPFQAEVIAEEALGEAGAREYDSPEIKVDALYSGQKAELRMLRDSLVDAIIALGGNVKITPHVSHESVSSATEFAIIKPVTRPAPGRILLGLALPDTDFAGRPRKATDVGEGDRITHEIVLKNETEIDDDLIMWLRKAYNLAS
jgi:hypothetical protein